MLFKRTMENTEQDVNDKFSVKELIEFERFCRDNALLAEMKRCFAANSSVTVSWFKGTGEEFVEASSKMKAYAPHKLYNTLVWLNNNKAVAITMATIQCRSNLKGAIVELQSDVKLIYRVEKLDRAWYIISMDGIYEKDSLIPVSPGNNIVVTIDELSKFRASYANLSYIFSKDGYKIDTKLPGIDRPETVNKLYQEANQWLSK